MKRIIVVCICYLAVNMCHGQEWFTSFDVAKRMANVQNKMLFVLWEDSFNYSIPIVVNLNNGKMGVVDLAKDTSLDSIIKSYFVPVKLSEIEYPKFINEAEGRSTKYVNKLIDDSVKIMDVNGNILNIDSSPDGLTQLSLLIQKYALDTSYLKPDFDNYFRERNFLSASLLAIRYMDFAIYADVTLRPELIDLAFIYLDEAESLLSTVEVDKQQAYSQKLELLRIMESLIIDNPRKANRQLKRIDESEIDAINNALYVFLNYTTLKLLKDEMNADLWKSKISSLDLKKAELIIQNNTNGSSN